MKKSNLKLQGYMLYKIHKTIIFYLFSPDFDELQKIRNEREQNYKIAKVYQDSIYELEDGRYLQRDGANMYQVDFEKEGD